MVIRRMEQIMKSKTAMEWKEIMDDNNIANKIVRHYRDIPKDKQAGLNGYFDDVPYFEYDLHSIPTPPSDFPLTAAKRHRKLPPLSGDTEAGYTKQEMQRYRLEKSFSRAALS